MRRSSGSVSDSAETPRVTTGSTSPAGCDGSRGDGTASPEVLPMPVLLQLVQLACVLAGRLLLCTDSRVSRTLGSDAGRQISSRSWISPSGQRHCEHGSMMTGGELACRTHARKQSKACGKAERARWRRRRTSGWPQSNTACSRFIMKYRIAVPHRLHVVGEASRQ